MTVLRAKGIFLVVAAASILAGCEDGLPFGKARTQGGSETAAAAPRGGETIERDVEAPEIFGQTDQGLWDGRPSLGGIWVAYPGVTSPERVKIRNTATGAEVIGALFRREREMPGPKFQVSSEAAAELGMLAGAPAEIAVVALKRETIVIEPPPEETPAELAPGEIQSTTLDPADTAAAAMAAVGAAPAADRPEPRPARRTTPAAAAPQPATPAPQPAAPAAAAPATPALPAESAPSAAAPAPAPAPAATPTIPGGSYVQIGIFSQEGNAKNAADSLRASGVIPVIREQKSGDKTYWRVLVGPVTSASDRAALLTKVRDLGYADAYAVPN